VILAYSAVQLYARPVDQSPQIFCYRASPFCGLCARKINALGVGINWFFPDPEQQNNPEAQIVVRAKKAGIL
jgi:hypothetical protein